MTFTTIPQPPSLNGASVLGQPFDRARRNARFPSR